MILDNNINTEVIKLNDYDPFEQNNRQDMMTENITGWSDFDEDSGELSMALLTEGKSYDYNIIETLAKNTLNQGNVDNSIDDEAKHSQRGSPEGEPSADHRVIKKMTRKSRLEYLSRPRTVHQKKPSSSGGSKNSESPVSNLV